MKKMTHPKISCFAATAALLASLAGAQAGSFVSDFNSGLPANSSVYGTATVGASGGYTNSGYVQFNPEAAGALGAFVITNDLDAGRAVVSFTASFKVLIGGGARWNYGDGLSFNFAPDVPLDAVTNAWLGVGSGLSVGFSTRDAAGYPDPAILAFGALTAVGASPIYVDNVRANTWIDTVIQLNPDNTLDVIYDGVYVYSKVPLGYTPGAGSLFWIGGSCSSDSEKHNIDNLSIVTRTNPAPYIKSFAPRGRQAPAGSSIDIVLTDYTTQVKTNTIALTLDGVAVAPTITQDGAGNTTVHFAPASAFAAASKHSVGLSFADNATPAQTQVFAWEFTMAEEVPSNFATVFSDGFESLNLGTIDKEPLYWQGGANGPNAAPNGSGNPWFGPHGPNGQVVVAENSITPHGGAKMIRGNIAGDQDALWIDLAYQVHGGQPIKGNCRLDWWYYDPATTATAAGFKDYISLYYYNNETFPATADWPVGWDNQGMMFWGNGIDYALEQSVSLGGSGYTQDGGNYDPTKYQIRLEEKSGATYGLDGWCNTAVMRSPGWHHNRIILGPPHTNGTVMVYFYIDDMANPVYSGLSTLAVTGFGLIEIATAWGNPDIAHYDDISFALVPPPNIVATRGGGGNLTLTWAGEGFTLQSASSVTGPWSDVASPATSGYTYNTASNPIQFFRLRN